jgi:ubiquinone/menaquinone biosynthesis C-methylase UbiE
MFSTTPCCGKFSEDAYIKQEDIGKLYDTKAPIYDTWAYLTETVARERSLELAEISDGQSILEVAVGTGLAFHEIVKKNPGGTNIGIDLSNGMLEKAKKRLSKLGTGNYSLSMMSAYDLRVESESIDIIFNNYMFDLIPYADFESVLNEFYRVLKPGGKLILVNMTKPQNFLSGIYQQIYKLSPRAMGGCRGVQMSSSLRQLGYELVTREYYQQFLFPSEVIIAKKS